MKQKYHYEWAAYTDNLKHGRLPIARGRDLAEVRREASASGKGAYVIHKERVYDTAERDTSPVYELSLVRRKVADGDGRPLLNATLAARYLMEHCYEDSKMWREKAYAVFLDKAQRPLGHMLLSAGGIEMTDIDFRIVAKGALDTFAHGVLLSHNHPSGDPRPGSLDIDRTHKLKIALDTLNIKLEDHIVVTPESYYSFFEEKVTPISRTSFRNTL